MRRILAGVAFLLLLGQLAAAATNPPPSLPGVADGSPTPTPSPKGLPVIEGVLVSPAPAENEHRVHIRPGDRLVIQVRGTRGATAWVDIVGLVNNLRLMETEPGHYTGALDVTSSMFASNAPLVAHLQANGLSASSTANVAFSTIGVAPPGARVPPPSAQTAVTSVTLSGPLTVHGNELEVRGKTTPGAMVWVNATILEGSRWLDGRVVSVPARADDNGDFTVPIGLGAARSGSAVRVRVVATSPAGVRSAPVESETIATGPP
jgi:hypothetical protein